MGDRVDLVGLDNLILRAREMCAAEPDDLEAYLLEELDDEPASFESLKIMVKHVCPDRLPEVEHAEIAGQVDSDD